MRAPSTTLLAIAAIARIAHASTEADLLPESRTTIIVQASERNPFGVRNVVQQLEVEHVETEESRLRALLQKMRLGGLSGQEGSYSAMLGPLSLRPGETLRPLIAGQTEKIRVLSVARDRIELGFIEKDGTAETRTITLPVSVGAEVHYLLPSQTGSSDTKTKPGPDLGGVLNDGSDPLKPR